MAQRLHPPNQDMKTKLFRIFVALTISLLIFLFPAYLRFADLADDDLFCSDLNFENPDDDTPLIDQHKELKVFVVSATFFDIFFLEINAFEHIPCFSFLIDPFDQKPFVFRC